MVVPVGGLRGLVTGPPTDELLQTVPTLRLAIAALSCVVAAEIVASRVSTALTDIITVIFGVLILRRDMDGFLQGLLPFTIVAAFNFLYQVLAVIQILCEPPGAKSFFRTHCMVQVQDVRHGVPHSQVMNLCSWRTILGNIAVVLAVSLEFLCVRLGWKMFRSMRAATIARSVGMLSMVDLEARNTGFLRDIGEPHLAPAPSGDPGAPLVQHESRVTNFTPFSGEPHRLEE